ncbi:unnamed protein product [Rotaria sordida]|uniref:NAD(P)(+)--arginine ADP-ribosyltransferase n=1 Tax=Rotaria sordida TaxID=392033 RepID=A0A815IKX4_9BILA|nr:unnamed protein product [Rotaria sordida]CAF3917826.1 unnamed protein product [Rotaria sordida]
MTTYITLIFYDINSIKEDICNGFSKYPCIFFDDQQNCIDYIVSKSKSETLFLIISMVSAIEILPNIHGLRQLDSVFIYSNGENDEKLLNKYSKIIGFFSQETDLFQTIEENIDLTIKSIESFKFYEKHQKSTRELTKESGSFLWLRLFKDVVLKLPHDEQAKEEMINKLKEYYHNNNCQLKLIEKFSQEYKSEDAIKWYTGQPFLYKQINRALRTEDINLLYKFRYFISDLSKALLSEYQILKDSFDSKTFYRGVRLSKEEAKILQKNVDKLISTNGYLSTSFNREVALAFTDKSTDTEISVLFEIECDFVNTNSVIMASIAHYNNSSDEEEVLFDLDATFQILSIEKDSLLNSLIVKMKVTDEGAALAQEYIKYNNQRFMTTSVVIMFGYLLTEIGQYDKSEKYFQRLLENPNGEDLPVIYCYMGAAKSHQGDYETALKYDQQSYDMLINTQPPRELASSYVLNDIGCIFHRKEHYDDALDCHKRALKIRKTHSDYSGISSSLGNIGIIYRTVGKYEDALDCLKECLKVKEIYLPGIHKEIANTLSIIADIYSDMDELDKSLEYHQRSLKINEKCLPNGHEKIAINLNDIATILGKQEKYDEALDYFIRALNMKENIFPNGHLSVVSSLTKIGFIYYKKKDYILALDYFNKALKMREKLLLGKDDIALVDLLTSFGLVYTKLHQYGNALDYHMRALNRSRIILPSGHFTLTECFTNIGSVYREMEDYPKAFQYFESALKNEKENPTKDNLLRLALTYDQMGICLSCQGDIENGLEYRLKAVRLLEKVYPRIQYANAADTIGEVYFEFEGYDTALECFFISLNIKLKRLAINDIRTAETLMNIGNVFIKKAEITKQYKIKARFYYEKALDIYTANKHINTIHILNRLGAIYENIHKYYLAIEYYRNALEKFENYFLSDDFLKQTCQNNLARIKWLIK